MTAGAGTYQDQAVDALLGGFLRMPERRDVVEDDASVGVHRRDDLAGRPQAGDENWHLVAHAGFEIAGQALVGAVNDQVDRERRRVEMLGRIETILDPDQPFVEGARGARVERRE